MEILSINQIRHLYPEQWVLVGNPVLDNPNSLGSVVSKLMRGVVLSAGKDKREIAEKAKDLRVGYESITCIYTGVFPKNRKWLL